MRTPFKPRLCALLELLCAALIVIGVSAARALAPGDVNGNGVVNLADAAQIKDHLVERAPLTSDALTRADANEDGSVDIGDVVWTVNHLDRPTTNAIAGRLVVPQGTPLNPATLTLISTGGDAPLNAAWEFSAMPAWDSAGGQFLFVEDASSRSLMLMYVRPEEMTTATPIVLTTTHTAAGLIAMNPICFSLDDRQRRELLDIAEVHADFPDLVLMIDQALLTSPTLLCDYDSFPAIYELAATICADAATEWRDSQTAPAPSRSAAGLLSQVGPSDDPHLDDWPGHGMTLVNPDLLFYGAGWGSGASQWTVLKGKDGLTQLIPPGWTPDVKKQMSLADGNYLVEFWKGQGAFWSTNPAERAGAQANVYKTLLLGLDTLAPPGWNLATGVLNNNDLIEYWTTNPNDDTEGIISIYEALNITSADDAISVLKKIVGAMVNGGVYEGSLTQKLAQLVYGATDTDGRALWRHFKGVNTWFSQIVKVIKVYDILNKFVPYFGQVFFYPNHYMYQINAANGVLSVGWSQIPPHAMLTASTAQPTVGQTVTFDASASSDDTDALATLRFRFDFESDGVWDTAWAQGDATETHAYPSPGARTCAVEVKDGDGLTAQARFYLSVRSAAAGTISIDVTPNTGQWRLFGPAGFTTVSGAGDRTGGSAFTNAPTGAYTLLCYDNVPGYNPPSQQTKTLAPGGSLAFTASWTLEGGPNETTIYLPGTVPLTLVRVPAGSFLMGRYAGERSSYSDEDPQHTVTIGYDYYMGRTEVTQKQWLALMGSWPGTAPSTTYGLGDEYPAYFISWNDCQNFLTALNQHITNTGQGPATFRLPSEAEWEYACRARTQTRFFFGDSLSVDDSGTDGPAGTLPGNRSDYMWFWFNCQGNVNGAYGSKPVGTKLPNQFGLYDMSGNVWEWCQDYWHGTYAGAPTDGSSWLTPTSSYRVVRGGSWYNDATYCRSANRRAYTPDGRYGSVGFRLAR